MVRPWGNWVANPVPQGTLLSILHVLCLLSCCGWPAWTSSPDSGFGMTFLVRAITMTQRTQDQPLRESQAPTLPMSGHASTAYCAAPQGECCDPWSGATNLYCCVHASETTNEEFSKGNTPCLPFPSVPHAQYRVLEWEPPGAPQVPCPGACGAPSPHICCG